MFTLRLLGGASLDGPDGPVSGRAALRQRIALLALLAVEHPRPISRDKLVADLWPESSTEDARHLLRESLYILRSALGDDSVLATGDDLRLNPDRLTCDLWDFHAALTRNEPDAAVAIYHGPFLSGFHLGGSEEFERWVDRERSSVARRFGQAIEQLAERASLGGDLVKAVEWWSRLAGEDPYNSRIALRYMQALEAAGDRAGALRHAKTHSDLLRADLDAAPEGEVIALAERLKLESRAATGGPPPLHPSSALAQPTGEHSAEPPTVAPQVVAARPTRRRWVAGSVLFLAMVAGLGVLGGAFSRPGAPLLVPRRVAATSFENRTGRPDLDDLGPMAADWIVRGLMETPLLNTPEVEAVYARVPEGERPADPLALAREDSAGMVVRGSYYLSGDSVLFQAGIMDVASGRMLRSFDPVGAPIERATDALEALRQRIAAGLSPLVNVFNRGSPIDPDLSPPPNLAAYREFVAGLRQARFDDGRSARDHYRRAATLDSTFAAPLVQLAFVAFHADDCGLTDSVATVLEPRSELLSMWNRMTINGLGAFCQGNVTEGVNSHRQRYLAYPRSASAQAHYAWVLLGSNHPRAAVEILARLDPERDLGWRDSPSEVWPRYWWGLAGARHALREYSAELEVTDRWADSTAFDWQVARGRALAALGREREVMELLRGMAAAGDDATSEAQLAIAAELWAHGHPNASRAVAEAVLRWLERDTLGGGGQASFIAVAHRLLGHVELERKALEAVTASEGDPRAKLPVESRIAVLLADTVAARRVDGTLAETSDRPLRNPWARGSEILMRAHIAVGLGNREQAVALLQDARERGLLAHGSSHAFHADLLLAPLRGYPPFDALLQPDN